jgi:hypothetical protein
VRLPYGRTTDTIRFHAPPRRAYDAALTAPAGSAIALTILGPGIEWTLTTRDATDCTTSARRTVCLGHFAAGGNPGGPWEARVHKTTLPAARATFSLIFQGHPTAEAK